MAATKARAVSRPALATLALCALLAACVHRTDATLAITHVSLIDVRSGTTAPDQTVLIRGRRILRIAAGTPKLPAHTRTLDGHDRFLIPGLWDMHVHMDSTDLRAFLAFGITGVRDMGGDLAQLRAWRRMTTADARTGPRIVFAGPLLRGPRSDADSGSASSLVIRAAEQGRHAVDSLAAAVVDFIKVHEGLSREAYDAIAEIGRAHV